MKSPPPSVTTDDCDDIFGPPRTYATGYMPPKQRLSMISAKYRQKEERRKVLKISINKLKKIEDPEASLCRSVLINNTMKRLQKEARDEKLAKQQLNYPRCYENDNFLNLKSEFIKNELKSTNGQQQTAYDEQQPQQQQQQEKIMDSLKVDFVDFDAAKMSAELSAKNLEVLNGLVEENLKDLTNFSDINATTTTTTTVTTANNNNNNVVGAAVVVDVNDDGQINASSPIATTINTTATNNNNNNNNNNNVSDRFASRKRSYDDVDDCDVQAVLSQFYMPPTPRMLTCIDDDEEVNVTDDQPPEIKRARTDVMLVVDATTTTTTTTSHHHHHHQIQSCLDESLLLSDNVQYNNNNLIINNNTTGTMTTTATTTMVNATSDVICNGAEAAFINHRLESMEIDKKDEFNVKNFINNNIPDAESRLRYNAQTDNDNTAYSCGHSSIFNDLQTNVFHSLIASLET